MFSPPRTPTQKGLCGAHDSQAHARCQGMAPQRPLRRPFLFNRGPQALAVPSIGSLGALAVPSIGSLGALAVPSIGSLGALEVPSIGSLGALAVPSIGSLGALEVPSIGSLGALAVPSIGSLGALEVPSIGSLGALEVPSIGSLGALEVPSIGSLGALEVPSIGSLGATGERGRPVPTRRGAPVKDRACGYEAWAGEEGVLEPPGRTVQCQSLQPMPQASPCCEERAHLQARAVAAPAGDERPAGARQCPLQELPSDKMILQRKERMPQQSRAHAW